MPYQVAAALALHSHEYLPVLLRRIQRAKKRVWTSIFVSDARLYADPLRLVRTLLDALASARRRGVDVRVLLGSPDATPAIDVANRTSAMVMRDLGIAVRHFGTPDNASTHSKYVLVDGDWLALGSQNWTHGSLHQHINSAVAIESAGLGRVLAREFSRHWLQGTKAASLAESFSESLVDWSDARWRLTVPKDLPAQLRGQLTARATLTQRRRSEDVAGAFLLRDKGYRGHVLRLLRSARQRIDVAMFFMTRSRTGEALVDALIAAHRRGVRVRAVLDQDRKQDPYRSHVINRPALEKLRRGGVPVRVDRRGQLLHSKLVLVDERDVVVGSHNWTAGSLERYDDTSVHVVSTALRRDFGDMFEALWRFVR